MVSTRSRFPGGGRSGERVRNGNHPPRGRGKNKRKRGKRGGKMGRPLEGSAEGEVGEKEAKEAGVEEAEGDNENSMDVDDVASPRSILALSAGTEDLRERMVAQGPLYKYYFLLVGRV